jgi:hypothetical protein
MRVARRHRLRDTAVAQALRRYDTYAVVAPAHIENGASHHTQSPGRGTPQHRRRGDTDAGAVLTPVHQAVGWQRKRSCEVPW